MFKFICKKLYNIDTFIILDTIICDSENYKTLAFFNPITILETSNMDQVGNILIQLEKYINDGFYAAGYITYEAGYAFEKKLNGLIKNHLFSYPLVWFGIYKNPVIINLKNSKNNEPFELILSKLTETIHDGIFHYPNTHILSYAINNLNINMSEDIYKNKIDQIKNYIYSGETYQINYTWNAKFSFNGCPFALYNELRKKQLVPYAALIKRGNEYILSFSPELFFYKHGEKIITKPMKGTINRGLTSAGDEENSNILHNSEKNRAENLMIVDLLRNDLNRICRPGSVKVNKLFNIEKYETLFQMTSEIEGHLKSEITYYDIFKSLFPCGSVTGAPKIRSMEIIHELEPDLRKIYTGSIGYISPEGDAVFNIAIRTPVINNDIGNIGIGSGIVWDSNTNEEFSECQLKMSFLTKPVEDFQLLETILFNYGEYQLLEDHIRRLQDSIKFFDFTFDNDTCLFNLIQNADILEKNVSYKVRLLVERNGNIRIENIRIKEDKNDTPKYAALSDKKIDSNNKFLYHKTTNRSFYNEMYEKAREKGYADLIFLNEKDEITEGCITNIFIKKNGILITPPVRCGLLNGIMRQYIIKEKNAIEDIITVHDLKNSEEIYLCNSIKGLIKVELIDEYIY